MKSQNVSEAKLAWMIWNALQQLSNRLWDRYDQDFLSFVMEENDQEWLSTLSNTYPIDDSPSEDR
jgi:hypothetical protein